MFRFNSLLHLSRHNIAIIGNGGFAREIACNLKKDSYKFYINKNFITKENIALEVKIILAPNTNLSINTNKSKNSFFSKDIVKKRYKNLFNSNHFKFSPIN